MYKTIATAALFLSVVATCPAKDAIQVSVSPVGTTVPIMVVNGNSLSPGTYAVGTIQLFYTVSATNFTAGTFASFRVDMDDVHYSDNPKTDYPLQLNLSQTGSANLILTPAPSTFDLGASGWTGSSVVTISIPDSVASNPSLNLDGTDLVANLQLETVPKGAGLDTATTVQVHIKLAYPTTCLRVFPFVTAEDFSPVTTATVIVNKNKGTVTSTNPGQFSDNLLVVNTCAVSERFDLLMGLDNCFGTNPGNNPGNAVFTYTANSEVYPSNFDIAKFGPQTPQGEQLCLGGVEVSAGSTLLVSVHVGINKGMDAGNLPGGTSPTGTFVFSDKLLTPVPVPQACTGGLFTLADPNPASTSLDYTTVKQN